MEILIVVLILAVLVVAALTAKRKGAPLDGLRGKALLTSNEKEFFQRLVTALPECYVFPQVPFAALIDVDKSVTGKARYSLQGRFKQKRADFVICQANTLEVIAIIELDDRTHNVAKDAARDALTEAAGYRTVRYQSRNKPDEKRLRQDIFFNEHAIEQSKFGPLPASQDFVKF